MQGHGTAVITHTPVFQGGGGAQGCSHARAPARKFLSTKEVPQCQRNQSVQRVQGSGDKAKEWSIFTSPGRRLSQQTRCSCLGTRPGPDRAELREVCLKSDASFLLSAILLNFRIVQAAPSNSQTQPKSLRWETNIRCQWPACKVSWVEDPTYMTPLCNIKSSNTV